MMIWTTRFSRKKAVVTVLLMGVVMAILILLTGRTDSGDRAQLPVLADNSQRVAYLQSFGWEVAEEPLETLQVLLPETLEEPYRSYNELQLRQGFDLTPCLGKQVSRYTYAVLNYPERASGVQANLYICEDQPVAGDICCPGANGFQSELLFPEAPQGN